MGIKKNKLNHAIASVAIPSFLLLDKISKNKLNGIQIKAAYNFLARIYGERCLSCNKPKSDKLKLEVDHRDGNAYNHYWQNLQLLCHSCNCSKRGIVDKTKKINDTVKVSAGQVAMHNNIHGGNAETFLKSSYLPKFFDFIELSLPDIETYDINELMIDASVYCGMASKQTISRYIDQLCSKRFGMFEKFKDERSGIEYLRINQSLRHRAPSDLIRELKRRFHW